MFGVNAAERSAAQSISAGTTTLDDQLGMGHSLTALMMASMQLKKLQQEKDILTLKTQIQQATGMPAQQDTTVAADVSNLLRQEIAGHAAEDAPERQGGIADLDTGNLGENYNNGGIVAFDDGGDVQHFQTAGEVTSSPVGRVFSGISDFITGGAEGAAERERMSAIRADLREVQNQIGTLGGMFGFAQQTSEQKNAYDALVAKRDELTSQLSGRKPDSPTSKAEKVPVGTVTGSITTAAPAAAPAADPAVVAPANIQRPTLIPPSGGPAAEPRDSGYIALMNTLKDNSAEGLALLKSGIRTPDTPKTAGEYAASSREQNNAYLKARGLPTAEESMKERLDNLATAGKEARNNRDVDRWMAAAQGFFAMAGGKSRYAMQNMADGLNIGIKEFRGVEQEYRKIDQLQKDKVELLKEATRQEARGDFAKGEALRKEAEDRKDKIDAANVVIGERMTAHAGTAMGHAISAKSATDARRDAAALRAQTAADSSAERAARAAQIEQGRTDRAKEIAAQKRTDSYQRAFKGDAAYKGLQEKESAIANLGPRESLKPKQQQEYDSAVTTRDALQAQINKRARAIAVREAQEDMGLQAEADSIISGKKK